VDLGPQIRVASRPECAPTCSHDWRIDEGAWRNFVVQRPRTLRILHYSVCRNSEPRIPFACLSTSWRVIPSIDGDDEVRNII